ncbi:MAG: IS256 family transposase [Chloroflexi bacterium]|nr:IS256 family transposase [Chloroflexota bacterium]
MRTREEYAVSKPTTNPTVNEHGWEDPLLEALRAELREAIESTVQQELNQALGAEWYDRVRQRLGYRHGSVKRRLGTPMGAVEVRLPRARLRAGERAEVEWRSRRLPRHARRMRSIDRTILSIYLSGTNQRRVAVALRPLLKGLPLSKSAVSRLAARLRDEREAWMSRELSAESIAYVFLDGFGVNVRRDGRVVRNPVLMAVGVRASGEKVLLSLRMAGGETTTAWKGLVEDLSRRGLRAPVLCIIDGSAALRAAVQQVWPDSRVQRCVVHKLKNLLAHAPRHAHEMVREDFHKILYACSLAVARHAYERFLLRWRKRCAAVAASLEEGGEELLTFYGFPTEQWKSLRSTNVIERVNGELRRRIKTQGAWANEEGVLSLLYGLFASGLIRLRRLDGWSSIASVISRAA